MKEITDIKEITLDFIIEYVQAKGQDDVKWLKETYNKPVKPDKNGNERTMSFIELRKEFVIKYFPALAPKPREKKLTMKERINAL